MYLDMSRLLFFEQWDGPSIGGHKNERLGAGHGCEECPRILDEPQDPRGGLDGGAEIREALNPVLVLEERGGSLSRGEKIVNHCASTPSCDLGKGPRRCLPNLIEKKIGKM